MTKTLTLKVLFVEDKPLVQKSIEGYMREYAFVREFVTDLPEFRVKFPRFKPDAVVVDYDLKSGRYYNEIFQIIDAESRQTNRFIGLVGVTGLDPFPKIKKEFISAGYHAAFFDNGTEDFYLDLVGTFGKFQDQLNGKKIFK
ncbi:MAG: response regulator [Rhabdochlamydiaceae bacterium]